MKKIDSKKVEQLKVLHKLFLKTKASDAELEKMVKKLYEKSKNSLLLTSNNTPISRSSIGRILTNIDLYYEAFPDNSMEEFEKIQEIRANNLKEAKRKGGITSFATYSYGRGADGHFTGKSTFKLDIVAKDEKEQFAFLKHIALYFHLNHESLAELFNYKNMNSEELKDYILKKSNSSYYSFKYLFNECNFDQELAKQNFIIYYDEMINAIRNKDIKERNNLIRKISDYKIIELKKSYKRGHILTEEELIIFQEYMEKYHLSENDALNVVGITMKTYNKSLDNFPCGFGRK